MTAEYTSGDTVPLTGSINQAATGASIVVHVKAPSGLLTQPGTFTDEATGAFSMDWPAGGVPVVDRAQNVAMETETTFSNGDSRTLHGSIRLLPQLA